MALLFRMEKRRQLYQGGWYSQFRGQVGNRTQTGPRHRDGMVAEYPDTQRRLL